MHMKDGVPSPALVADVGMCFTGAGRPVGRHKSIWVHGVLLGAGDVALQIVPPEGVG